MKWSLSLLAAALVALTGVGVGFAEEDPWGTEWEETTAAQPTEATTPSAPASIPPPPDPISPQIEDSGDYLVLADQLDRTQRIILLVLIGLLGGYLLPAVFYLPILRRGTMDPGPAAGLCLGLGGLLTGWTVPMLLATSQFQAGALTPWYLQWDKWAWSGIYFAPLLLLAAVAFSSRGSRT